MSRNAHPVITTGAEIDAAIARAQARPAPVAVAAAYDRRGDAIAIRFANGVELRIPRALMQGLRDASPDQVERIRLEGSGTGLVWPWLGVAHYVPGLIAGVFGARQWMAELGRRGGSRRTKAKALAARANGAKGGRPRRPRARARPTQQKQLA